MLHLIHLEIAHEIHSAPLLPGVDANLALAQDAQDHEVHHPEGAAGSTPTVNAAPAVPGLGSDKMAEQMSKMQDMHRRMQAAKSPAERQALMGEHLKLMQSAWR